MHPIALWFAGIVLIVTVAGLAGNVFYARQLRLAALRGELAAGESRQEVFEKLDRWRRQRKLAIWACIAVCLGTLWAAR